MTQGLLMRRSQSAVFLELSLSPAKYLQWNDWQYRKQPRRGPDPRKVDTSGVSYAALVSVAEVSASKASGATRLHQECRRRVL